MERRQRYIPCPRNAEACKYAPDCELSQHHLYPRRTADTSLKRRFGNLIVNKVLSCRNIHDILDTFPPPEYPEDEDMKTTIKEVSGDTWIEQPMYPLNRKETT